MSVSGAYKVWMRLSAHGRTSLVMTAAATGYAPRLSSCWLRVDRRHVRLLAVLDLQNDCSLDRVAVFVELVGSGDTDIAGVLHSVPDVGALDRSGSLEGIEEQPCCIICKSSECVGRFPVFGCVCCDESLDFGGGVAVKEVVGEGETLDSRTTYLDEVR